MLPLRSGILVEAISIASSSLQQIESILLRFRNAHNSETVAWSCSVKKVFLKISQNSQVFSVNFAKF